MGPGEAMIRIENFSRRGFLKGMVGAGAFVLSARLLPEPLLHAAWAAGEDTMTKAALQPNVYLAIATDGTVYIIAHRSEMGSGNRTGLPMIVADELDADWNRVTVVQATGNEKYGDQDTDGSHSVRSFFDTLREAGGSARLMLVRAAAQAWNVPEKECTTEAGMVVHKASGKKLSYGELAPAAAKLPVPKKEEVQLKAPKDWKYIGKPTHAVDLKEMSTGKAIYGHDTRVEGMLYASVMHPPVYGGAVKSVDDAAALKVAGVKKTETIEPFKPPVGYQALGGVAVLADNTWAAFQGKKKLKVEWTKSEHSVWTSDAYRKQLEATASKPCKVVRENGNVEAEFAKGGKVVEAGYYAPMLAHASMEPPAALAVYRDGKVDVWASTQNPQGAQDAVKDALGLKKEDVTINVTLLGGGFGRKSFQDFIVEAAVLSKKTGKPVKVVWSREDDIKFDSFHSVAAMYFKATLGADRVMPKEELPKDYTNYDGDYGQYPVDIARFRRVVQMVAEKSGWGKEKLGSGLGMGIAVHRSFLTYVATVVKAEVKDGQVKIHRVDSAVDAGTIVNPTTVTQRFEGAAVMGTSVAMYGEITATNGVVDQSNFDGYPVARMNATPRETHVHIVKSEAPPAGIGEPGLPPFAPALYNAIFAATGKRHREMPLSKVELA